MLVCMSPRREMKGFEQAVRWIDEARDSKTRDLDLSGLNLNTIPDSLVQLSDLQSLNLSNNQISTIPDSLVQLVKLKGLQLQHNQIVTIPESLAQLTNLHVLGLWRNKISTIPDSMSHLANLRFLGLGGNQITTIPDSLAQLAELQELFLWDNQIAIIPEWLAELENLRHLHLEYNRISTIPDSFRHLSRLTHLALHGNMGLGIPKEILGPLDDTRPTQGVLRYYFAQREGSKPLNEAKLILMGSGGVGKTSAVKALTMTGARIRWTLRQIGHKFVAIPPKWRIPAGAGLAVVTYLLACVLNLSGKQSRPAVVILLTACAIILLVTVLTFPPLAIAKRHKRRAIRVVLTIVVAGLYVGAIGFFKPTRALTAEDIADAVAKKLDGSQKANTESPLPAPSKLPEKGNDDSPQPPVVRSNKIHTRSFMQIEGPDILQQYSFIAPGKQWGGNIHSTNPGPDRLFDVLGFSMAYVVGVSDQTRNYDREVRAQFRRDLSTTQNDYSRGAIKGVPQQGIGSGPWTTVLTKPLTQEQCDGLFDGTTTIYIVSWCIWKDSLGHTDTATDCRSLQPLPKRSYSKKDIVWHYCQP
jgi:hypothetical protein